MIIRPGIIVACIRGCSALLLLCAPVQGSQQDPLLNLVEDQGAGLAARREAAALLVGRLEPDHVERAVRVLRTADDEQIKASCLAAIAMLWDPAATREAVSLSRNGEAMRNSWDLMRQVVVVMTSAQSPTLREHVKRVIELAPNAVDMQRCRLEAARHSRHAYWLALFSNSDPAIMFERGKIRPEDALLWIAAARAVGGEDGFKALESLGSIAPSNEVLLEWVFAAMGSVDPVRAKVESGTLLRSIEDEPAQHRLMGEVMALNGDYLWLRERGVDEGVDVSWWRGALVRTCLANVLVRQPIRAEADVNELMNLLREAGAGLVEWELEKELDTQTRPFASWRYGILPIRPSVLEVLLVLMQRPFDSVRPDPESIPTWLSEENGRWRVVLCRWETWHAWQVERRRKLMGK